MVTSTATATVSASAQRACSPRPAPDPVIAAIKDKSWRDLPVSILPHFAPVHPSTLAKLAEAGVGILAQVPIYFRPTVDGYPTFVSEIRRDDLYALFPVPAIMSLTYSALNELAEAVEQLLRERCRAGRKDIVCAVRPAEVLSLFGEPKYWERWGWKSHRIAAPQSAKLHQAPAEQQ